MKRTGSMIFTFVLMIGLLVGYIMNIYKLCTCDFKPSYKAEVFYTVGLVTGLGSVIGYFDFGK